ncbi:hypothetical protein RI129_012365 [Pyrocoelia pectoralis]|uniref:Uncharacterized protein n=1 Tax=Pyrocoelia pectoralis TaxID=417401 RepID=A0AAN7UT44_9COLE
MDPLLAFEVLIYLNVYFYPTFAVANVAMWAAKFTSSVFPTPNIERDGLIMGTMVSSELFKLLLFRKLRPKREGIAVAIAVIFTTISILCLLYVFINQEPVLKLEYGMDSIMMVLLITEMFYGAFVFIPCCNKPVVD